MIVTEFVTEEQAPLRSSKYVWFTVFTGRKTREEVFGDQNSRGERISLFLKFFLDRVHQNSLLRIDLSDLINRLDRERRREFFPIREWN